MGSYSGGSDWDDLPERESFEAFHPQPAAARQQPSAPVQPLAVPDSGGEVLLEGPAQKKRINAIIAFDTTGSMTPWVENVQQKMEYLALGMLKLMDMEIEFIGVGDHSDGKNMLQIKGWSRDAEQLKKSAHELDPTDGGDTPEAFECLFKVLNADDYEVPTVLIVITDSIPHGMTEFVGEDDGCPFGVDWRDELDLLRDKLQKVYLVSCATDPNIVALQRRMVGENSYIHLDSLFRLTNLIMAICMEEAGDLEFFMSVLEQQRGPERKREVLKLLGRETT
jgi:hypothetical protein